MRTTKVTCDRCGAEIGELADGHGQLETAVYVQITDDKSTARRSELCASCGELIARELAPTTSPTKDPESGAFDESDDDDDEEGECAAPSVESPATSRAGAARRSQP